MTVVGIRRETPSCVSIAFDTSNHPEFLNFKPGQYLTFELMLDGQAVRRSYSICSAPGSGELRVAVKAVEGGWASVYLTSKLSKGDVVQVRKPEGNFLLVEQPEVARHHVFFAAGSGITPVFSMLQAALKRQIQSSVTLIYGNKTSSETIFREELEALSEEHPHFEFICVCSQESARYSGRITAEMADTILDRQLSGEIRPIDYYLCGPSEMITGLQDGLDSRGVNSENIHQEFFSAPVADDAVEEVHEGDFSGDSIVTFTLDDEDTEVTLASDGDVALNAALDLGLDAPFSCKGGVCTTCRAKVLSGKVRMENNYALTDGEIAEGYILTCQSHPNSPKVHISYDEA